MRKTPAAKVPTRERLVASSGFPMPKSITSRLSSSPSAGQIDCVLTQRVAARRIGATQLELSKILGGKFSEISLERRMRFLTALGYHIELTIGARQAKKPRVLARPVLL